MFVAPCIPIFVLAFLFVFVVFFMIVSHGIHVYTIALYSNFQIRTLIICVKDAGRSGIFRSSWALGGFSTFSFGLAAFALSRFSFSGFSRALSASGALAAFALSASGALAASALSASGALARFFRRALAASFLAGFARRHDVGFGTPQDFFACWWG